MLGPRTQRDNFTSIPKAALKEDPLRSTQASVAPPRLGSVWLVIAIGNNRQFLYSFLDYTP